MADLNSNAAYLTIVEPAPLENVGWSLRALSSHDYATTVAVLERFDRMSFTVEANDVGGGRVVLDADDPVLTSRLGGGVAVPLVEQEALFQVLEDGAVRFEWLGEDVDEDQVVEGGGSRSTTIAGRGTAAVLEWAPVLPSGWPDAVTDTARVFDAHPMAVWAALFAEAQAVGYLPFVTLLFDGAADSAGAPWGPNQVLTVEAGTTLLELLTRWCDVNDLVWRMLPGFRLQVFQSFGSRREGEVAFTVYRSQGAHKRKLTRRDLRNVVVVSSGDGVAVASDSSSIDRWGRRAAWVTAGDASDASARSMIANTNLALGRDQKIGREVVIIPDRDGRWPFDDFAVHDWVRVEVLDDDTASGVMRVVGLAVEVDATTKVTVEATLQTRFEVRAVRLQRLLARLGAGAMSGAGGVGGSTIPATVQISKALAAVKLADLADVDVSTPVDGSVLQLDGSTWTDVTPALSLLEDVDVSTIPPTGDLALGYNRATGLWEPAVSAGGSTTLANLTDVDVTGVASGDLLTFDGTEWVPGQGGGGLPSEVTYWQPPPHLSDGTSTTGRWAGSQFVCSANATITAVRSVVNTVTGNTYRFRLYELDALAVATIVSTVGTADAGVATGATRATVEAPGLSWPITAGTRYALMVTNLTAGAGAVIHYATAVCFSAVAYAANTAAGVRATVADPSGALATVTSHYAVGFTATPA